MSYIYPIILSGGVGSRLWPLSRSHLPKQLLKLAGKHSLIQETALRVTRAEYANPIIICHSQHRYLVAEHMRAIGVEPEKIMLEPSGRNTAPAAAVAALMVAEKDPAATLLLIPADHVIHDHAAFRGAVAVAQVLTAQGYLVTFGVRPRGPDTGYGYIHRGSPLAPNGKAFAVSRFVEKPNAEMADCYVRAGDHYWNSGIFAFQASSYLAELHRLEPDILVQCQKAISGGVRDAGCFHLAQKAFESCKSISIDYAVMEHTDKAAVVPVDMGWNDIGSWQALWDISNKDANGNVLNGDVVRHETRNSYLRSDGPLIAAVGINDLVVVATPDAVVVSSKSATQDIKKIVEQLERGGRDEHLSHRKVDHPWGSLERIDGSANFQVSRITVNPASVLQLQPDKRRNGRWVVLSGIARITCGRETFLLKANETCSLADASYRLENATSEPLHIIETQLLPG